MNSFVFENLRRIEVEERKRRARNVFAALIGTLFVGIAIGYAWRMFSG